MDSPRMKVSPPLRKRRRVADATDEPDDDQPGFRESNSVVEQAEKYRLGTVRLPVDCLSPHWHAGAGGNRSVNRMHVDKLLALFLQEGLKRKSPDNHLRVACQRSQVEKMLQTLTDQPGRGGAETRARLVEAMWHREPRNSRDEVLEWPLFEEWETINGKAELMDGQHRVEALKLYIQVTGASGQVNKE
jgi:hypothetical protein